MSLQDTIRHNIRLFTKYGVVGLGGTAIDVLGFTALVTYTGLPRNLAASISFTAAVVNNYSWNRIWTFRSRAPRIGIQFATFAVISVCGLALNLLALHILSAFAVSINGVESAAQLTPATNAMSKLGASAAVALFNFLANRYITFHPRHDVIR